MLNVNQLTEQLRMLPDAALQRVAQMYKQDPYILPMVISEDMARKKLRQAAQAQAMQPQPKVVDQAVAAVGTPPTPPQAAPGIAALQAPNMERMADGGIAGYAEGGVADTAEDAFSRGGMFDFTQRSEPVVRMAGGGAVARFADQGLVSTTNTLAQVQAPVMEELKSLQAQLAEAERVLAAAAKSGDATSATQYARAVQNIRDKINTLAERSFGNRAPQVLSDLSKPADSTAMPYSDVPSSVLTAYGAGAERMPQPFATTGAQPSAPPAAAGAQAKPPAAPGIAATPAATGPGRAEDILAKTEREGLRRLYNMQLDAEWRGDEERRAYEAGKPKGEAYASMSERLKKMEEAEPGEREQAKGMAIFNAGLAMMAGSSPYALQNIAKGALAGTSEYAGALKEFKQAAKERMKLEADIEQARRAEARGDNETALKLLQRKNDRVDKIEEHMVDLGAKMGISKADVAAKVDLLRTELNSRERIAAAQLAQEPGDIRSLRALMADPNLLDMLRTSKTIGGESSLLQKMALEAVKDPAGFKAMEKLNPGAYAAVMAEVAKLGGTSSGVSPAESALVSKYLNKP